MTRDRPAQGYRDVAVLTVRLTRPFQQVTTPSRPLAPRAAVHLQSENGRQQAWEHLPPGRQTPDIGGDLQKPLRPFVPVRATTPCHVSPPSPRDFTV